MRDTYSQMAESYVNKSMSDQKQVNQGKTLKQKQMQFQEEDSDYDDEE